MSDSLPSKKNLVLRSLLMSCFLTILKFTVGVLSQSVAMLASATDSFMDLLVSLVNFGFLKTAEMPADENHPYGHGKIESLAGLFQSLVIGAVAIGIAVGAVLRFMHPRPITHAGAGVAVMVVAMSLNFWHVRKLRRSMQETGSQVMASEYVHYASDFLSHLGVILSFILFKVTGSTLWDPLMSFAIIGYLVWAVSQIFRNSISELLDEQLAEPIPSGIAAIIRRHDPRIIDFHELRTRKVGDTKFIEFHIELRAVKEFEEAHNITESLIARLREAYPGSIITVHTDPEGGI
jgi:ferrous-iron efflux pump FieF